MHRLESISRPPNSPRHRKMLFPPIEMNNKSTGLLARTLGTSVPYPEKRSNLDEALGSSYVSSHHVGVLTGADVFAPPPPKTYRRLIGTPPPRPLRKGRGSEMESKDEGTRPSIRVQDFGGDKNNRKLGSVGSDQLDEMSHNPFVPMYSSDLRFNRPLKMTTTELNNDDESDQDDSDYDADKDVDAGAMSNYFQSKLKTTTTPQTNRLQPPPRIMTWKSDGSLMNDLMVQEWRGKEWDPTPSKELSLSADFGAIKSKMKTNRMKSNNASVRLTPLKIAHQHNNNEENDSS